MKRSPHKEKDMALKASEIKVGDSYTEEVCNNLSRTQIVQYAGASGDYNPLHSDEIFTTQIAGYPSVFAHGMLSMGMTGKMLTNYVGDGRLSKYGVRFTSQVFPGATLTATATIASIREADGVQLVDLDISTTDESGTQVIKGSATARIDT
jgi:acyl dehydratase